MRYTMICEDRVHPFKPTFVLGLQRNYNNTYIHSTIEQTMTKVNDALRGFKKSLFLSDIGYQCSHESVIISRQPSGEQYQAF